MIDYKEWSLLDNILILKRFIAKGATLLGTDTEPYQYRHSPSLGAYKTERDEIVGGTVAWNQFINKANYASTETINGITFTNNGDGSWTISGTATANAGKDLVNNFDKPVGHKEMLYGGYSGGAWSKYCLYDYYNEFTVSDTARINVATKTTRRIRFQVWSGQTVNIKVTPMFFDLTQMFGSTIADYIYSLETANAGAGVAFFKRYFGADYYPFDSGSIRSVEGLVSHTMKDENDNIIGEYPLDSTVTLRGKFDLVDGKLKANGNVYPPSGGIARNYAEVDLGSLDWTYYADETIAGFYANILDKNRNNPNINIICGKYPAEGMGNSIGIFLDIPDKSSAGFYNPSSSNSWIYIKDSSYTDATSFKTAMNGVYLVYELATPTTETATPYAKTQKVDPSGTEEYVTTSVVPVGHNTEYYG